MGIIRTHFCPQRRYTAQDLLTLVGIIRQLPSSSSHPSFSYQSAMSAYTTSIQATAKKWHAHTKAIQSDDWPKWLPDYRLPRPTPTEGQVNGKAQKQIEPPKTIMKLNTIDGWVNYAIANLILNYLIPIKFLRVRIRRAAEWLWGGVVRSDFLGGKEVARL